MTAAKGEMDEGGATVAAEPLDVVAMLRKVEYLAALDDAALADIARVARRQSFAAGATIVSELEPGADVYVIARGEAEVSVDASDGERHVFGTLGPGGAFGEMSSLTGDLRSATVKAKVDVDALIIPDEQFDALRERRPEIAVALVRTISLRLAEIELAIDALFASSRASIPAQAEGGKAIEREAGKGGKGRKGSIARVWRELVVAKRKDLAFITLVAFVLTLVAVRAGVYAAFRFDFAPKAVLRAAYMTGFTLLIGSACASLLTYRPSWRRVICVCYGIGVALIFNELGVTLAFDIYFKDIHTADPDHPLNVEHLYRRTEPLRAIAYGLVVLIQAAYLRRFYARAGFVVMTRLRKLVSRS